ncbi:hypothetical protein Mal64_24650 [Pseudobythopirellula maris]|uniref:Sulfotransferase domain protein n=1 Tax=Pseudobythopirellula maris TaxID=2527991 RepID=A0A5C5ZN88_9BACT|nr:sulfotransferase [Pseudobythopirellula maris]TWT88974.1 hypothetical protein Mal64_24650 [Pseudobythopirellula maris]
MTDDELLRRPIVVLGAPRSGTTVLSQLLRHHPDLCLIDEPRVTWKYGNDRRSDLLRAEHARPEVRRHIRHSFAQQVRASGRSRLVEKTPSNSLRAPFVDRVLDDAIFIHMMRDGRQSVLSIREYWKNHSTGVPRAHLMRRLKEIRPGQIPHYARELFKRVAGKLAPGAAGTPVWGPRIPGLETIVRDQGLLAACAAQWRSCVEAACRDGRHLPHDRYTECRLEDFDEQELRRLLHFADLSVAPEVIDAYRDGFDSRQPGGRTKGANDDDVARVEELIAPTVAWLATLDRADRHKFLPID